MRLIQKTTTSHNRRNFGSVIRALNRNKYLYLLMLPGILYMVLIHYRAAYGLLLAFKDYNASRGIMGSEWVGLKHFKDMFSDSYFRYVLLNTIKISFGRIIFTFIFPIIIALSFNELKEV